MPIGNNTVAEDLHGESRLPDIARLYCDTRLGGQPRFILTDKLECLMYVPDEVRKSVVFIGYKKPDGMHELMGTGFFMARIVTEHNQFLSGTGHGFVYIVTAKHVIDGIRDRYATHVTVRVNYHDGQARWLATDINDWLFHPTESDSVDVAVFRASMPEELDHISIPLLSVATERIISEATIGIGDEVFLAGLFAHHHGTQKNIPIVRVGNIAAMPEEPVEVLRFGLMDAYLIEARSLGGISGSPVFVHIPANRAKGLTNQLKFSPTGTVFFLLGLMHGHWDEMYSEDTLVEDAQKLKRVNTGIAIVVPATKILEVIEQPMIRKNEEALLREERKKNLPTADTLEPDQPLTQEGFQDVLKLASRKSSEPESETNKK